MKLRWFLAVSAVLALGGCTKAADSPTVVAPSASSSGVLPSASTSDLNSPLPSSLSATPTSASVTPPPTSSAPASSTPPPPVTVGCAASALTVSVQRGSGVAGHQYATVTFENKSSAACPLAGFPGIALLAGGTPIGTSVRSTEPIQTVTLKPGASAVAQLVDASTCNGGQADHIQVIAPNTSTPIVLPLPLALHGCTVTVSPVRPA